MIIMTAFSDLRLTSFPFLSYRGLVSFVCICLLLTGCSTGSGLYLRSVEFDGEWLGIKNGHMFDAQDNIFLLAGEGCLWNGSGTINVLMVNRSNKAISVLGDSIHGDFFNEELGVFSVGCEPSVRDGNFKIIHPADEMIISPGEVLRYSFKLFFIGHPEKGETRSLEFVHQISEEGKQLYWTQRYKLNFLVTRGRDDKCYDIESGEIFDLMYFSD